jgi:SsrA-binding protein
MPTFAVNKKARHDYQILQTYQVGLVLSGKMVKEFKENRINLNGKFVVWQQGQLQIIGIGNDKISENISLLVKKSEQNQIREQISQKGISCVPLSIYRNRRWLKAEIALVKGKKDWDKREDLKKRDIEREMRRNEV